MRGSPTLIETWFAEVAAKAAASTPPNNAATRTVSDRFIGLVLLMLQN